MYSYLLLSLLGLTAAAPAAPPRIDSLSPYTGKPLTSNSSILLAHNASIKAAAASSWWYPNLDHSTGAVRDYAPDLKTGNSPDYDYPVYIAVASGDAAGFTKALYSNGPNGDRDNYYLAAEPRTIYLAPGTYTLSSTAYLDTDTIIIGDASNPPTIKAASGFNGDYLITAGQGGPDNEGHGESHFSVMIKNVILDTTANSGNQNFGALSWRVAQNSALVNVVVNMPQGAHTGLFMGQGSTIQAGDISFNYGTTGVHYSGHQQATLKNMKFHACTTGILIDSGFAINVLAPTFDTVGRSVVLNSGAPWLSIVDAKSTNSGDFFTSNIGSPNFMLENIQKDTTNSNMVTVNGNVKVGGSKSIGTYIYGNTYGAKPVYQTNPANQPLSRNKILAPNTAYPISSAPQYPSATINDVINLKDKSKNGGNTLQGDGTTNDGPALQAALNTAASAGKIAYLPFGIYKTQQTITIPSGTRLVGNGWSTISGAGSAFSDENNPTPIVRVGTSGQTGTADIQDMRFTVSEQLPGAIVLQVNLAGSNPGDVAIHNSLITIGGTRSTSLSCDSETNCRAAYVGLHLAAGSTAYIDNFWSWVADHTSDDSGKGFRTAAKGGVLVESTKGTWLTGVGSEHYWLYNLAYNNAANVFSSLYQSETNYNQGNRAVVTPPAPFHPTSSDPNFSYCDGQDVCPMTIAQYFNGASEVYQYAAGSWNFFGGTQANMNVINKSGSGLHLYGLTDHTAHYIMRLPDGTRFGDGGNDGFGGSWGTLVAKYTT